MTDIAGCRFGRDALGSRAAGYGTRIDQGLFARLTHGHGWPSAERLEAGDYLAVDTLLMAEAPDVRMRADEDRQAEDLAVFPVPAHIGLIVSELAQRFDARIGQQFRLARRIKISAFRRFAVVGSAGKTF